MNEPLEQLQAQLGKSKVSISYGRVQMFSERLVRQALAWEGTASGEHGIGQVKRGFMVEEHGASVAWMRRLKALFDPDGLLNPGKLF